MLPRWVKLWFFLTIPIIAWDAAFVLLRPASMEGDLAWIWTPYELYLSVDRRYGDLGDTYVVAQSWLNLAEGALGALALWLSSRRHRATELLAFSVALMTMSKTIMYFLVEIASGFAYVGHAEAWRIALLYAGMNGVWIAVPGLIVLRLGRRLTSGTTR